MKHHVSEAGSASFFRQGKHSVCGPFTMSNSQSQSSRFYDLIDFLFAFFLAYLQNVFQTQVWLTATLSSWLWVVPVTFRDGNDFGSHFIVNTDTHVFRRPYSTQRLSSCVTSVFGNTFVRYKYTSSLPRPLVGFGSAREFDVKLI
jgi:hypothetical protein